MGVPKLPANCIPLEAARENPQSDSQRKMHTNQWTGHLAFLEGHVTDSRKDTCHSRGRAGTRHRRTQSSSTILGWSLQEALPWGISCRLSVSSHLWQLRKRLASSLPSSYCGSYWELGMGQWSLGQAGLPWMVPAPLFLAATSGKGQRGLPKHGYSTAICYFTR